MECVLAEIMFDNINQPVSRDALDEHLYGSSFSVNSRKRDVVIGRPCKKLQRFGGTLRICSMRNNGHKLGPINHVD